MSSSSAAPLHSTRPLIGSKTVSTPSRQRHDLTVRVTHWIATGCFFALLLTGIEILISHPRFYWGDTGNDLTQALFQIPIPSSRQHVPTGYSYTLPDQNGWSRALHFQSAWLVVLSGFVYVLAGVFGGHFRRDLVPDKADRSLRSVLRVVIHHLRFERPNPSEAWSYNVLQRLAYLFVLFILFPAVIWTGLAMSPAFTSAFPATVTLLGGRQSARTLHFFISLGLVGFLFIHVVMVWRAGFWQRVRAMITGRQSAQSE